MKKCRELVIKYEETQSRPYNYNNLALKFNYLKSLLVLGNIPCEISF